MWSGTTLGHPVVSISERLRLSSGHHGYGSLTWPLGPQAKDGVVLEYTSSTASAIPRASISREHILKGAYYSFDGL